MKPCGASQSTFEAQPHPVALFVDMIDEASRPLVEANTVPRSGRFGGMLRGNPMMNEHHPNMACKTAHVIRRSHPRPSYDRDAKVVADSLLGG